MIELLQSAYQNNILEYIGLSIVLLIAFFLSAFVLESIRKPLATLMIDKINYKIEKWKI